MVRLAINPYILELSSLFIYLWYVKAIIVSCCGCFHGRTLAAISMSCDNEATRGFWPLLPGNLKVDFGDAAALERVFKGMRRCVFNCTLNL